MGLSYKKCPNCRSNNTKVSKVKGCFFYRCQECDFTWDRPYIVNRTYKMITKMEATVGGFHSGHYTVEIDFVTGYITWFYTPQELKEPIHKYVEESAIHTFLEQMKALKLLDWKASYCPKKILDGTSWSMKICLDGKTIRKNGHNDFPDEWHAFCKAVATITGGKFS